MTQQNPFQQQKPQSAPAPVDEFELMRQRLKKRGATTGQERQAELQRQFAAFGNIPSGAALKVKQQAATANERATNEAIQDVNIAQAQTLRQERESSAQRDLSRELQTQQIGFQERESSAQRDLSRELQTQQIVFQEREGLATRSLQQSLAELGAKTDLEKAQLAGANAIELEKIRGETAIKERGLIEAGMNERQAQQIASSKELFDLEMDFKERGLSIDTELKKMGLSQAEQDYQLNKTVTALNSLDLLYSVGFNNREIGDIVAAINLPFQDQLQPFLEKRYQQYDVKPSTRVVQPSAQIQGTPTGTGGR